ncbi:hypothetical protein WJX73_007643 [Symbiochloris irregularis]|uniref:Uncharacterized protein n=1 Tax=Symbiochloris irregularis TaxID=706552 RepID=A0AAW1NTC9_9CHLO
MAMRGAVARLAGSAVRALETRPVTLSATRHFATIDDKERAEEKVHFKREDEKALRALLNKVKKQADAEDTKRAVRRGQTQQLAALNKPKLERTIKSQPC